MVGVLSVGRLLGGTILGSTFSPLSLFSAGEQGAWYDPSDLSTMFQDSVGTTPVTAVEQPVGLMLDKSKGLALGAELVTNGGPFTATSPWYAGQSSTLSVVSSKLRVSGNGVAGYPYAGFAFSSVVGRFYKFVATVTYVSGTDSAFIQKAEGATGTNGYVSTTASAVGTTKTITAYFPATTTTTQIQLVGAGANSVYDWDNISVRELPGNHASQSTAGAQPVLKAASNVDFDGTDDKWTGKVAGGGTTGFLFVAGIKIDVTGSNQTIWSDTGTNTGYRVRINSSNQVELAAGNGSFFTTAVTTDTLSASTNYVIAAWHDGTNLNVSLSGGAVTSQAFVAASAGTTTFTVGMDNGAVSSQLNGKVFNAVCVKDYAGSIATVNNAIAYVNGKLT